MEPINNKLNLYSNNTPSTHGLHILLDSLGIDVQYHKVNIWVGEHYSEDYKKINPNCRVPAIVDNRDGQTIGVFETGAIMQYLTEKSGKYLPDRISRSKDHWETIQWLYWFNSSFAPQQTEFGYYHYFAPKDIPDAKERSHNEVVRLYKVLNDHLATRQFMAANELTIADFGIFTWLIYLKYGFLPSYNDFPNIVRYYESLEKLPLFKKEVDVVLASNFNNTKPKFV
ncbi:putative glutathione S-transferase [Tieghemostelium lacteum]|uniref:Putative glutathione S-transferase n=1 Tax=Tieghemostelium lacteum TaxID=361077 RepID=A0A152A169_TIELA|nr:putative glutathione S-transferase [Tieghemostelium lacteum]|eukprot:KYQ99991.1 putative glutathione S-transferase [Tieghemostelium lacteum]